MLKPTKYTNVDLSVIGLSLEILKLLINHSTRRVCSLDISIGGLIRPTLGYKPNKKQI